VAHGAAFQESETVTGRRDRRQFLKELTLATLATATVGATAPRLARGATVPGRRRRQPRAFNVVAIGDSIVWGQGLPAEAKFTSLTRDWLEARLQRPVTLTVFAHSGAVIHRRPDDSACTYKAVYAGEPPNLAPSIIAQAWWAAGRARKSCAGGPTPPAPNDEVDLVLLDGGINDVDIVHILNPAYSSLAALTRKKCRAGMVSLLGDVALLFPNAKVVVTGYYPIVSEESDVSVLGPALLNVGVLGVPSQFTAFARKYGGEPQLRRRLAAQSLAFHRTASGSYVDAVAKVNKAFNRDYRFVDPNFAPRNAIGAPDSWLWPVNADDPARTARIAECTDRYGLVSLLPDAGKCRAASMGHPNVAGAAAYAAGIVRELETLVPAKAGRETR
jgi:hypothetical protein